MTHTSASVRNPNGPIWSRIGCMGERLALLIARVLEPSLGLGLRLKIGAVSMSGSSLLVV